jgi:TonB-dependent SusC/RagA subfamily outer membrane receptor
MKHTLLLIALLFSLNSLAQRYDKQWERVIKLESEGLIKQAAAGTDSIYALAKKSRNEPQIIKAFFFTSKFIQTLDKDAHPKIIASLRNEIKAATVPTRAILESIYAEILNEIYRQDSYKINQRTNGATVTNTEFTTWSAKDFKNEITRAYNNSLVNRDVLYKTKIKEYEAIIDFNPILTNTDRSLYDFLFERYLINASIYHFDDDSYFDPSILKLEIPQLFGNSEAFLKSKLPDSLPSAFVKKVTLCREMEHFYSVKSDAYSLQRAVLRRLKYLADRINTPEAKTVLIATLQQLGKKWDKSPFAYRAMLQQAQLLRNTAHKITAPDNYKKALSLYDVIIENAALNDAAPEARNYKNEIVNTKISLRTEKFVAPNSPILALVGFKNADDITIRIYKLSHAEAAEGKNQYWYKAYTDSLKPIISKTYILPNKADYFEYTTEIVLPSLKNGFYLITASSKNKEGNIEQDDIFNIIQSTGITLTETSIDNSTQFQITERTSGKPLKSAKAVLENEIYISDKNGRVTIPGKNEKNENWKNVIITHGADTLDNSFYRQQYYKSYNKEDQESFFAHADIYLDRAIYRPGQTLYFKGIVTQSKKGKFSTVPNTYFTVIVSDTNDDELKTFRLKTNDFGSFTGEYTIPKNVLTGEFRIEIEEDEEYDHIRDDSPFWDNVTFNTKNITFKVEEYKRPTFEVVFNPAKNDIRLNEKALVSGMAKSFSGATLSNAKVVYRVTRSASMTKFWQHNYNEAQNIAQGEVTTDANGKFKIDFTAAPDPAFGRDGLPVFTYTVSATVTDMNGESHSSNISVLGGYHSLLLTVSAPAVIDAEKGADVTFASKNLNGEERPAAGNITIYKVADEARVTISRPWTEPEIQTIPREEFERLFPYLPYKNEVKDSVVRLNAVYTKQVNTASERTINLKELKNWASGNYQVVFAAKDSLGTTVEDTTMFTLKNEKETRLTGNKTFVYEFGNTDYKKDGYIKLLLRSKLPALYVNVVAGINDAEIVDELVVLKDGRATIKIPVTRKMNGNMIIAMDFIWQNQYYTENTSVDLTDKPEKLQIEWQTLSNKLLPGSNQTWSFTIKNGNRTPAEVLASMYDASLDQFATEYWQLLNRNNNDNSFSRPYKNIKTYGNNYSYSYNRLPGVSPVTDDKLYTFGFSINRINNSYWSQTPKNQLPGSRTYKITGIVSDESDMPIPGATIIITGTTEGTQTDFDGKYIIYANKGDVIFYSFIGLKDKIFVVEKSNIVNIKLDENLSMALLEEVVVTGYGSMQKSGMTASATTINSGKFEGRPGDFVQTLQGQVLGLKITTGSGQPGANDTIIIRGAASIDGSAQPLYIIDGVPLSENEFRNLNPNDISTISVLKDATATNLYGSRGANGVIIIKTKTGDDELKALQQVKARKNFNETAFFYPQLITDKDGKLSFSFTTPEALTEWKLRLLAHNKKAISGYFENTFVTQKDLMVVPNLPRFLREKDTVIIMAKISNMTGEAKTGSALLQLYDAVTMQPADVQTLNVQNVKPFTLAAKGSTTVSWKIAVPVGMQGVQYKILAKAGDFTDGEENILPVLTNSMLVTESLPLWVKPNSTKTYTFNNLKNNTSTTLRNHGITLEYTSNPAWTALQSLPYLMGFEHECAEQLFSRFYANAIATHVINSNPKIAEVFAAWRKAGKPVSKMEQNEELKSIIISETPWMLDAESEEEKKNRIALLFDLDKMKGELDANFKKLDDKQLDSGGFAWFGGTTANSYITRHILAGFGHLNKLNVKAGNQKDIDALTKAGITYTDTEFLKSYKLDTAWRKKNKSFRIANSYSDLHYLYMRSFYIQQYPLNDSLKAVVKKYTNTAKENWLTYSLYDKGMAALALHRFGDTITSKKIIASLKDSSANDDENGMYWIANKHGWYWYDAPIETQALLIEAFTEVANDVQSVDAMKVWLLKQKQNRNWPTTKSTSEAIYALLMQGSNWLSIQDNTAFKLGDEKLLAKKIAESEKEAGTGYMKLNWKPEEVTKDMATLTVENKTGVPGYGGFYWQYFEELDKIKPAQESIMNVSKELYIKANTATGQQLQKITAASPLKIGALVTVRLVLDIKEDVEFVHLKDLRAAAFEPVDVLSGQEYADGLSYYRSTRDVATHFFFDNIKRGTYVLEYDVRVNNAGEFSNGITTIQSMYAPEFSGHTVGTRVKAVK